MAHARDIVLTAIALPEFGEPTVQPSIPTALYEARVAAAMKRAREAGLDALIVYGDREHNASIAYLTGYDPRFEEALLVIAPGRSPTLLVGNEGKGLSRLVTETCDAVVSIPISAATESLNAGIAVSVALYEISKRRAAAK